MIFGDEAFGKELVHGSEFLMNEINALINKHTNTRVNSLVVQWLGLGLPMQGVRVPSLVRELRPHMQRQSIKHRNKQTKKT